MPGQDLVADIRPDKAAQIWLWGHIESLKYIRKLIGSKSRVDIDILAQEIL